MDDVLGVVGCAQEGCGMHKQVAAGCRGGQQSTVAEGSCVDDYPPLNCLRLLSRFINIDGDFGNYYAASGVLTAFMEMCIKAVQKHVRAVTADR